MIRRWIPLYSHMKAIFLSAVIPLALASALAAQTQICREVVRDGSGRVVQTVERRKEPGGTVQVVSRDAAGRVIGTATTRPTSNGGSSTVCRDASGRLAGTAMTQTQSTAAGGSSRTTYRDASGRLAGSADTRANAGTACRTCSTVPTGPVPAFAWVIPSAFA